MITSKEHILMEIRHEDSDNIPTGELQFDSEVANVELVRRLNWDAVLVHNVIGKDTPIAVPERLEEDKWQYKNGDIITYSVETDCLMITERGSLESESRRLGEYYRGDHGS